MRESHRARTVFRKVGGFVYVMSVLVSLEDQLGPKITKPCNDITKRSPEEEAQLLLLLYMVFFTISTAMRFEPANAKFFHQEVSKINL